MTLQQSYAQEEAPARCKLATLQGRYVFDATGYNIINGIAVPKTVVEFLKFKGDGSLTSIATVVVGGAKIQDDAPATGSYTVNVTVRARSPLNHQGLPLISLSYRMEVVFT